MREQCCLGDEAYSRWLWVSSLMRRRETNQDCPYPSQKRKLRLREVVGHLQGHTGGAQWSQGGNGSFLVMAKPVISGRTETCNGRS